MSITGTSMVLSSDSLRMVHTTGKGDRSVILYSRTRKAGLMMAHVSAAPRATASAAFMVKRSVLPVSSAITRCTAGTRMDPPTTSTAAMSASAMPEWSIARLMTARRRSKWGLQSSSSVSRVTIMRTSLSSMRHSRLSGACGLADSVFFTFSQPVSTRIHARVLVRTSILYFSLMASTRCVASAMSRSRPPKLESNSAALTSSVFLVNATTDTVVLAKPTSTNMTFMGLSSGRSVLKRP
mmetsp:Transcript_51869/g.130219  ORF Transcript_51869/g.130219 Transcript_51869/m.130219 type:complete len:239 (+) Transcript_51869:346-1062(+)